MPKCSNNSLKKTWNENKTTRHRYYIKYTGKKKKKFICAVPEGHLRQAMGRPAGVDDGLHDGSTDVVPPLISKCSWASFSLISHIFPSSFFNLFFYIPADISLIPGTAGHEGLLVNRCHLYAVLPFSLSFSLFVSVLLMPHTSTWMHTDTRHIIVNDVWLSPLRADLLLGLSLSAVTWTWEQMGGAGREGSTV